MANVNQAVAPASTHRSVFVALLVAGAFFMENLDGTVAAIALFTFASILCGITNGLWQFTAARILQGIGGAMMVPVGRLVVLRITEKKDLMRWIEYITWPGLMAPVLGPPLGGFITTYSSWRWIFYLNLPLGVIGTVLALLWTDDERENTDRSFDWLGFALAGSSCVAFMYSL